MNTLPSLSQAFDHAQVPLEARDKVTALAAARRLGYSLPLPTEPVGSPIDYYNANYGAQANSGIGAMNEVAVMDYDFALKAAQLYWLARYKVLHEPESSEAVQAVTGLVESLMGQGFAPDLGFTRNAQDGTEVVNVDGRTALVSSLAVLAKACESLAPTFDALWAPAKAA